MIAAEDTRKAHLLLSRHGIKNRVTSYHDQNKRTKLPRLVKALGENVRVALISEAGTPGLNDPGYELILACINEGIPVVPVPGPSAIITALVISGLPTDRFVYLGYLPRRSGERRRYLESLSGETRTMVCLEAPHRLLAALADMKDMLGDRRVAACREMTKLHEEVFRGRLGQAIEHFGKPRGEFTLVVEGATGPEAKGSAGAESLLKGYHAQGLGAKQSVARVAGETGLPKKEVYRMWVKALSSY